MPVAVSVPVRLAVDARAALDHPDWIESAVSDAVRRALARSKEAVLTPRGGYLGVDYGTPSYRWHGADLARVPARTRAALERAIDRAITAAAKAADISKLARRAADSPRPLDEPAQEAFDRGRYNALLQTYEIPSYQRSRSGGTTRQAPIQRRRQAAPAAPRFRFRVFTRADRIDWRQLIPDVVRSWGTLPSGVSQGLLYKVAREWHVWISTDPPSAFQFEHFGHYEFRGKNADPPWERTIDSDPTPDRATATRTLLSGGQGLRDIVNQQFSGEIESSVRNNFPRPETMSLAEYDGLVQRSVDAEIARRVEEFERGRQSGTTFSSVVRVQMGSYSITLLAAPEDDRNLHWTGTANLLPVAFAVPGTQQATDDGEPGTRGEARRRRGRSAEQGEGGGGGGRRIGSGTGESAAPRGGFVFVPGREALSSEEGALFPQGPPGLFSRELECGPFEGEPEVDDLGSDAAPLRRMIDEIAFRLQMPPCCADGVCYAANFAIRATMTLGIRASAISAYVGTLEPGGFTQPASEQRGSVGPLDFRPVASPAIQFMRHLAGVVPRLSALRRRIFDIYGSPQHRGKITGTWAGNIVAWQLRLLESFTPTMKESVGYIFLTATQSMLLQLLQASRQGIEGRIARFNEYAPIFERLMVTQLTDYSELQNLRDRLQGYERAQAVYQATAAAGGDVTATIAAANPATAWFTAARALSGAIVAGAEQVRSPGAAYQVQRDAQGVARIRDRHGTLWSMQDLEYALPIQRGMAEGIDPLVKQIKDIPDVLLRFRTNRNAIREELWRVLYEMRANNEEMLGKARRDVWFCFKSSRLQEGIPQATVPGSRWMLQGIHREAHNAIGEHFLGDVSYALGIDYLFNSEAGREALTGFFLMVGIVALAVLCPPAAFLGGATIAAHDVAKAREKERLFGALIDPELVLTRAEVEMELFAAYLGFALSLIPEAGTVVGALGRGARVAVRQGLRSGLRQGVRFGAAAVGRQVARQLSRQIINALRQDLLQAFVRELLVNVVMDNIIQHAMAPVLAHIEREAMIEQSVGGPAGARFVVAVLSSGQGSGRSDGLRGGLE